ncbi:phage tail protein [Brevibacillus laterosporus]|uniref:phage tail protein n=1 Tax=Brevibacillus laterosporus TaxID=1465 RepID=UPI003D1B904A
MITIDASKLQDVERQLGQYAKKAPIVLSRALNRAATSLKTNATKEVRASYMIKAGDVKSTFRVSKSRSKNIAASVTSSGNALGIEKFKIKPQKSKSSKTMSVQVKKDGGVKGLLNAFVAEVNGNKVFEREKGSKHKKRKDGQWTQLPIKRLFGPPVPIMLKNERIKATLESEASKVFDKRLAHEISRVLEGN